MEAGFVCDKSEKLVKNDSDLQHSSIKRSQSCQTLGHLLRDSHLIDPFEDGAKK